MMYTAGKESAEKQARNSSLPATGERFLPQDMSGEVELEHLHRYALACELARNKAVLDIASGEGYGSNLLAQVAKTVIGVDLSPNAIAYAERKYLRDNLEFRQGSCAVIPLADHSVDLIVSFETIEHHDQHTEMLEEIKRVLKPDGVLCISTPDKLHYSDLSGRKNEFHIKELYFEDFRSLLAENFKHHSIYGQKMHYGSVVMPLNSAPDQFHTFRGTSNEITRIPGIENPLYFLAIASDLVLPEISPSIFDGTRALQELLVQVDLERCQFKDQLEQANRKLNGMTNSIYWRITFPLRIIGKVIKKFITAN